MKWHDLHVLHHTRIRMLYACTHSDTRTYGIQCGRSIFYDRAINFHISFEEDENFECHLLFFSHRVPTNMPLLPLVIARQARQTYGRMRTNPIAWKMRKSDKVGHIGILLEFQAFIFSFFSPMMMMAMMSVMACNEGEHLI